MKNTCLFPTPTPPTESDEEEIMRKALHLYDCDRGEEEYGGLVAQPQDTGDIRGANKRAKRLSQLTDSLAHANPLRLTDSGQAFTYDQALGYFRAIRNVSAHLAELLGPNTTEGLLERDLLEIAARLRWRSDIRCDADDFNAAPERVNLVNGVLDLASGELLPHNPEYNFSYVCDACYLEGTSIPDCPAFDHFCRTSLGEDPAKRQLLLEMIGYICSDSNDGKCALFFKGEPNTGKSLFVRFLGQLFDPEVVSHVPLHKLGDRFFRAELAGKKLNSVGEIAGRPLRDISVFKSITGGDRIAAEFKGKDPFYFTPRCKMLFSGNVLPLPSELDATVSFVNRIRVLIFPHSIPPEAQDRHLFDKIWQERDAIVTKAIHAYQHLVARNYEFTTPADSMKFLKSYGLRSNVFSAFVNERCIVDPDARVFNRELYDGFRTFCQENAWEPLSKSEFFNLLSGLPGVEAKRMRIGRENRQGHSGICLKND